MIKVTIIFLGALTGVACAQRTEPETPATSEAQQMTPASGAQPVGRDYPSPAPAPVDEEYEDEDEGLDYTVPPSDVGPYRDDAEAPPP